MGQQHGAVVKLAWPVTAAEWQAFEAALASVVHSARALDEVLTWLAARLPVRSIELAPHLMKSNPPQRWIRVNGPTTDGRTAVLNLRIAELPGGGFRLLEFDEEQSGAAG